MAIEWAYWLHRAEIRYKPDCKKAFPRFVDTRGEKQLDFSPFLETISAHIRGKLVACLDYFEFESIVRWKQTGSNYKEENIEQYKEKIQRQTLAAFAGIDASEMLTPLVELAGVAVPTASAILTAFDPFRFCVIDYRVIRVLAWLHF